VPFLLLFPSPVLILLAPLVDLAIVSLLFVLLIIGGWLVCLVVWLFVFFFVCLVIWLLGCLVGWLVGLFDLFGSVVWLCFCLCFASCAGCVVCVVCFFFLW